MCTCDFSLFDIHVHLSPGCLELNFYAAKWATLSPHIFHTHTYPEGAVAQIRCVCVT